MALSVYKVDGNTRLVMPDTQWTFSVLVKLTDLGHQVDLTDEDPDLCLRDADELSRRDALLEEVAPYDL